MVMRTKSHEIAGFLHVPKVVPSGRKGESCLRPMCAERKQVDSDGLVVSSGLFLCVVGAVQSAVRFLSLLIAGS
jgi:hypothetical protein